MATLPRPEVKAIVGTTAEGKPSVNIEIGREEGKSRAYQGVGSSNSEAVADVVKKILGDPITGEWLP